MASMASYFMEYAKFTVFLAFLCAVFHLAYFMKYAIIQSQGRQPTGYTIRPNPSTTTQRKDTTP